MPNGGSRDWDISAEVLGSVRRILNDETILFQTNLRTRFNMDSTKLIQLAVALEQDFAERGHPFPSPIDRSTIAQSKTVDDLSAVVRKAFG